jgi:hypothetical protein
MNPATYAQAFAELGFAVAVGRPTDELYLPVSDFGYKPGTLLQHL